MYFEVSFQKSNYIKMFKEPLKFILISIQEKNNFGYVFGERFQ